MTEAAPIYVRISPLRDLPSIRQHRQFRAVVVLDGAYSNEWQDEVSRWLVDSGCLYMMAWGPNCVTWDDSVDHAQIQKYPDGAPERDFVLTTWHEHQTLEEVFWDSQFCAHDPYDMIRNSLIIHVGDADREAKFLALYERAKTLADREES